MLRMRALMAVLASPATAQAPSELPGNAMTPPFTPDATASTDARVTDACLVSRARPSEAAVCIGIAATLCIDALGTTAEAEAIAACYTAEAMDWHNRFLPAFQGLEAAYRAADAAERAAEAGNGRADDFIEAQGNWERWRSSECALTFHAALGGGGERVAEAACQMQMVAERALMLQQSLDMMEGA